MFNQAYHRKLKTTVEGKGFSFSDGVSKPISASLGFGLVLAGFRSRLGLEGYRSRDFPYCKGMVLQNFYNSTIFCLLFFLLLMLFRSVCHQVSNQTN